MELLFDTIGIKVFNFLRLLFNLIKFHKFNLMISIYYIKAGYAGIFVLGPIELCYTKNRC